MIGVRIDSAAQLRGTGVGSLTVALAVAAFVIPSTGSALDLAWANAFTSLGALCFLIGAVFLLPGEPD